MSRRSTYSVRPTDRVLCVFVPGLKGSVLKCECCDRRTWPPSFLDSNVQTIRRVLTKRSMKIESMLNSVESECLTSHPQTVCGIVRKVRILNGLYTRDVYATFLENLLVECDGVGLTSDGLHKAVTLHEFAYDWTRGVRHAAETLFAYLQCSIGVYDAVVFVAHSMGGLVCRYLLEELCYNGRDEADTTAGHLYRKVKLVYALGVPHYGTVRALHHLIDPLGGDFAERCRRVQSLYDMIPFSDLNAQIDGLSTSVRRPYLYALSLKRYRSDLFLKRTDGKVIVNRDDWRPPDGRADRTHVLPHHVRVLVDILTSRFPVLARCPERLHEAAGVHFALNSELRPTGCAYLFLNAVGLMSPSSIDRNNFLFRRCAQGDGVVCSIVDRVRSHAFAGERRTASGGRPIGNAAINGSDENAYGVHVKMLKHIDVFRVVRETVARELYGGTTVGRPNGIRYLWRRTFNDGGDTAAVSSSTFTWRQWSVTAINLVSGRCVLSVRTIADGGGADEQTTGDMIVDLIPTLFETRDRNDDDSGHGIAAAASTDIPIDVITSVTVKPANDWRKVTVIIDGHYTILTVHV